MDAQELHRRLVAGGIHDLVEVELPSATYHRINDLINSVLTTPVPGWIMSLFEDVPVAVEVRDGGPGVMVTR